MFTRHSLFLILFLLVIFCLSGCRIKFPSIPEQKKIMADGGYTSGAPPWASDTVLSGQPTKRSSLSLMPDSFSSPRASRTQTTSFEQRKIERQNQRQQSQKETAQDVNEDSPLHRISEICPSIEKDVTKALVTTDAHSRLQSLQSISKKCPESADLWYWQAKDHFQLGELSDANRCVNQALVLSASHKDSLELARKIKAALENQRPQEQTLE